MTVPPSLRRAGRILGWSLLGLVLVLFFALAGGMAFLRTQPGERWIADTAVSVLKNVGSEAQIGSLEGPLPFSLHLRDVRLADGQGGWLDVPEATLRGVGQMITGKRSGEELGGIVRIAEMSGDISKKSGLLDFIVFMCLLSINLGLINLFPIPVLDGGHVVIYLIEIVTGKEINNKLKDS